PRTEARARAPGAPRLTEAERKEYAEKALRWLARMARGETPGYDARPAGDSVLNALHQPNLSKEAVLAAVEIAGRLPGPRPQTELANVVMETTRPIEVRKAAAQELVRHLQTHGLALTRAQSEALEKQ